MIKIAFDSLIYSLQSFGGASVYWAQLVSRVAKDPRFSIEEKFSGKWLRGIPACTNADIFHSSHFRTCLSLSAKTVSTVHDLTYELGLAGGGLKAKVNILERKASYFTADALICISDSTKKDLLAIYPQLTKRCPIHVIHHGLLVPEDDKTENTLSKMEFPYILYVGARKGYKNFATALAGFHESGLWKDGVKLVCTGNDFDESEWRDIRRLELSHAVISLGRINAASLFHLYKNSYCLLYPSRHEGFGLPLLEAMSQGCPVIATDASCIPEVAGNAALLVPPLSVEEMARAIKSLRETDLRNRLVKSGLERIKDFSWEKSVGLHMKVYEETARA